MENVFNQDNIANEYIHIETIIREVEDEDRKAREYFKNKLKQLGVNIIDNDTTKNVSSGLFDIDLDVTAEDFGADTEEWEMEYELFRQQFK